MVGEEVAQEVLYRMHHAIRDFFEMMHMARLDHRTVLPYPNRHASATKNIHISTFQYGERIETERAAGTMTTQWLPCGVLNGKPANPYAVLILNQPLNKNALDAVLPAATMLVCADAGADQLYKYDKEAANGTKRRLPDAIIGDLDSLSDEVGMHYRDKGVQVIKDPDQYTTDFTKCLQWIRNTRLAKPDTANQELDVMVLGGLGGRVDQGFSQIHHLYLATNSQELLCGRIYLLSEQSLTFVLSDGCNAILIEPGFFEENVGIIPILGPANLTTKGLEWDVQDWRTEFGGLLSTSNHIRSKNIEISFSGPRPLFTMELASRFAAIRPR